MNLYFFVKKVNYYKIILYFFYKFIKILFDKICLKQQLKKEDFVIK